jgi:hypothetical protein
MTKVGIIHTFLFAHVIFDGDLNVQEATNMTPKTSAAVQDCMGPDID